MGPDTIKPSTNRVHVALMDLVHRANASGADRGTSPGCAAIGAQPSGQQGD